ncbi:MAG: DUF3179 domain-containing protein [Caldilineae bacterium]|nr:MAG: DUF3179 domain-containing protein [Caldilineae bacterium]
MSHQRFFRFPHLSIGLILAASALIFAACTLPTPPSSGSAQTGGETPGQNAPAIQATEAPAEEPAQAHAAEPSPLPDTAFTNFGVPTSGRELIVDSEPPPFSTAGFKTDFTRRTVEWDEILSGGPPKDGIPAVDDPQFESIAKGDEWLADQEPVILFEHNGVARAYPLSILIWHEIVNDEVAGQPVSITFCPLCNASIAFDRNFDGQVLDFGTTGRLRNSDLVMYDRQTETWWQQFTGEGIIGTYAGEQLRFLPSQVISWGDFKARFPDGEVLARPERNGRFLRNYGRNPYVGYDSSARPFLFLGQIDDRLPATSRVLGLTTEEAAKAYPFSLLAERGVVMDEFGGVPLVIFHKKGAASALDAGQISSGKDVGAVAVFDRRLDGQTLTFTRDAKGAFVDEETHSTWNILGEAVDGPLAGAQLTEILHFDHFWFAWAAFFPQTEVFGE